MNSNLFPAILRNLGRAQPLHPGTHFSPAKTRLRLCLVAAALLSILTGHQAWAVDVTIGAGGSICQGGSQVVTSGEASHLGAANDCFSYWRMYFSGQMELGIGAGVTISSIDPDRTLFGVLAEFSAVSDWECYDTYIDGELRSQKTVTQLNALSYGFTLSIDKKTNAFEWDLPRKSGRYKMKGGTDSTATPSVQNGNLSAGSFNWLLQAAPVGCTVNSSGVISGCTGTGTIKVKASNAYLCYEEQIDVGDCDSGCSSGSCSAIGAAAAGLSGGAGAASPGGGNGAGGGPLSGPNVNLNLGSALSGDSAGFLQLNQGAPFTATPASLEYRHFRFGVEKITNSSGLRQVRAPEVLVNVGSTNSYKTRVEFYSISNIIAYHTSSNLYVVTNSAFSVVTIENPGDNTNALRITQTREGTDTVWDYTWLTNGWELSTGNGSRKEVQTVEFSETNTLRTVTYQIKENAGTVVFQGIQKFRTNSFGERLIEEVTGTGPNALTNSFAWTTNGYLQQVVRGDGSWESYVYDSQKRATNIFSSYRNQGVTTDKALCRLVEHTYSTNFLSGSGDEGFLESTTPRRSVEYLLGQEVGRSYFVALPAERRDYRCVTPGAAWNDSSNLVTVTKLFVNGFHRHETRSIVRPDGTAEIFEYGPIVVGSVATHTNRVYHGHPDSTGTNIDAGTKTETVHNSAGRVLSQVVSDVPSGITLSSETYQYDGYKRLTNTVYLDGTSAATAYDCCSVSSTTDREGTVTSYTSDALKRILTTTRNGITISNVFDAAGNVLSTVRIGTNGSAITTGSATFDNAERQMTSTDALSNTTSYTNYVNGSGQTVKSTTHPNASTRVETYNRDGSLTNVTGTAVHGQRYDYGVESEGGTQRAYTKEIKLDTGGSDSSEWIKTYADMVGRNYKTVFPDSATSQTFYNTNGQAAKQVDPDGVTTLSQYDNLGELEYTAVDLNANGTIDFAGTDRITRSVNVIANNGVKDVRRTSTYVWATTSVDASTLISVNETSVDGLRAWNAGFGVTNQTRNVLAGSGNRFVTNTAPDGTVTVQTFQNGRLTQRETRNAELGTLSSTIYGYDAHGRQSLATDARTGTTTNSFDNADRVTSVSTPAPASGQAPQVTSMTYNNMGWVTTNTLPDGGVVATVFHLTGEQATNSGARTYPVAYAYDYAGRLQTMTTWTNFASAAGAAVTQWKYDGPRGWLTNKVHADGKGPAYTYTPAARLSTRAWARGVTTTYGYNAAGDLSTMDYSDSTADVTNSFDRRGRTIQTTAGATSSLIFDNAGNLLSESFSAGALSGITLTNQFDSLLRRTNVVVLNSTTPLLQHGYAYDSASRVSSVTFGTNSATYAYLTNSALVDNVVFKNGATTRMTTSNRYDNLNRLALKDSRTGVSPVSSFSYAYNTANQRTAITNVDNSRWAYAYDTLGQVTSGKRYWSDGTIVAGQQFEYAFDDIGNRQSAASGGDQYGANLRFQNYSANNLNQYTQRTVPPYVDVQGSATNTATVTVNLQSTYRKGDYFRADLGADNSSSPLWFGITNVAVFTNGSDPDIVTTNQGNVLVAKATEAFLHDLDGNLTSDSLWTNTWNGENRLIATESASAVLSGGKAKETWSHLPDGRWIERVISTWNGSAYIAQTTNRFVWDGQVLLAILDHTNGLVTSFARGLDLNGSIQGAGGVGGVLAVNIATNSAHFVALDGNGNVSTLVGATDGAVTAQYEFDPFGNTLRANGVVAKANPIRFSTQFENDVTGRKKYLHRELTDTGRWLSRDPIGEKGGKNPYAFVRNSPVIGIDYTGLWSLVVNPDGTPRISPRPPRSNTIVVENGKPSVLLHPVDLLHCDLIQECIRKHEQSHVDDVNAENPNLATGAPNGQMIAASTHQERKESEIDAYVRELACLREAISKTGFTLRAGKPCSCQLVNLFKFKSIVLERLDAWKKWDPFSGRQPPE